MDAKGMIKLSSALLALSLFGCSAHYEWLKEGADETRTQSDMMACREEMSRFGGAQVADVFDDCMAKRGYDKKIKSLSIW